MSFDPRLSAAIQASRLWLTGKYPFYASLFGHMRLVATTEIPTAAIDAHDNLYINPQFYCGLSVEQRAFVNSHEVLHPALEIFRRSVGHDPRLSNEAHDYAINAILALDGKGWLVPDILLDERFAGMCYEDIYAVLFKEEAQAAPDRPSILNGDVLDGKEAERILGSPGTTFDEAFDGRDEDAKHAGKATSGEEWRIRVARAFAAAQAQGRISAGVKRVVGASGDGVVEWNELLRAAIQDGISTARLNYNIPSRRSDAYGCFMPAEVFHGFDVTIIWDTSGSIPECDLEVAASETRVLLRACGWKARWLAGDAAVLKDEWIDDVPEVVAGGGGTSFVPFFERLQSSPTKTLVVFTDTFGAFPDYSPDYHVIWAVYQRPGEDVSARHVPFGEIVAVPEAQLLKQRKAWR